MATTDKSKHAFGKSENLEYALSEGLIDAYDILLLDSDTDPKIGWVTKDGDPVLIDTDCVVTVEGEEMPETGEVGKVYIYADEGYFWNGTEFKPVSKPTDLTELTTQITELGTQMEQKVDVATVDTMIKDAVAEASGFEIVEF